MPYFKYSEKELVGYVRDAHDEFGTKYFALSVLLGYSCIAQEMTVIVCLARALILNNASIGYYYEKLNISKTY